MRQNGDRVMRVTKLDLIEKINENKLVHVTAYNKAVIAYKEEAIKQLNSLIKDVEGGCLTAKLSLTTPVDNRDNYDKLIKMFEWDNNDEVELTQREFNEYILDETESNRFALQSNLAYLG